MLAQAATARAAEPSAAVALHAGQHEGYTRLVYELPPGQAFSVQQAGDLLLLALPGAGQIPGLRSPPDDLLSVNGGLNAAAIGLKPGETSHVWRLDHRLIVDIFVPQIAEPAAAPPPLPQVKP